MYIAQISKVFGIVTLCLISLYLLRAEPGIVAEINSPSPDFSLEDQDGNFVKLSDYRGKIVVLEWMNPDCPYVQRHYQTNTMKNTSSKYDKEVVWLAINSTYYMNNTDNKKWADNYGLDYPILNDNSGQVGKLYGAKTTPHMYIKDINGLLVYMGAIDDDPKGTNKNNINYVEKALSDLKSGKNIKIAETKPYGCSVKYKKD